MNKNNSAFILLFGAMTALLTGCDRNDKKEEIEVITDVPTEVTKSFSVHVTGISVTRISTGEAIAVDIDGVASSGQLTTN